MTENFKFLKYLLYCGINPAKEYSSPHCFAMKSGSNLPFCNRAGGTSEVTSQEIKDLCDNYFTSTPFRWFVDARDTAQIEKLLDNQFTYVISYPGMILKLEDLISYDYATSISIKEINDAIEIKQWIDIVAKSYNLNGNEFERFVTYLHQNVPGADLRFYTGYYDGEPVATSMTIQQEDVVGVHWVGTLPEYRSRGLGYAITHKSLVDAKNTGADQTILMASELGRPVYIKMGFKEFAQYQVYKKL